MENEILDDLKEERKLGSSIKRLIAYLIDIIGIIILIYVIGINFFSLELPLFLRETIKASDTIGEQIQMDKFIIRYISFLIWVIYSIILDCSKWQGTLGKKLMNIKVVDIKGNRLNFLTSAIRNSTKLISYLILGIGFLWILIDKDRRGWHDIIAKTVIVER